MWIARRTDYATRALLALCLAPGNDPVKLHVISERTQVPQSVLEQVMLQLRNHGIVRSERGPEGGYRLNKDPAEISLEDVVRLFQGPLAPIACATRKNPEPCPMMIGCSMRTVWEEVRDATIRILEQTTGAFRPRELAGTRHSLSRASGAQISVTKQLQNGRGNITWPERIDEARRVTQDLDIVLPADQIEDFLRVAGVCGFENLNPPEGFWPKLRHKDTDISVDILPEGGRPGTASRPAPTTIPSSSRKCLAS